MKMNEKEFIKWLDENSPVDYEEVQHFSDEAGEYLSLIHI